MTPLRLVPVPCLRDNYAYLVGLAGSSDVAVVDPSEAPPVLAALEREGVRAVAVLNTHHHFDHVGGNEGLLEVFPGIPVFGHASDRGRIPAQSIFLEEGQRVEVAGLVFDVLHIPGHTLGAIAYVGHGVVFTGDTLFSAGCGRLFEGTPAMMHVSINEKLAGLAGSTRVYPGHEYTASNLRFAAHLEPHSTAITEKAALVAQQRAANEPTVGSTLDAERTFNPFLRCDVAAVRAAVGLDGGAAGAEVLGAVRAAKDSFQ